MNKEHLSGGREGIGIFSLQNILTLFQSSHWSGENCMKVYQKMGLYRSASESVRYVIYQDGMALGRTFKAVTVWAHGTTIASGEPGINASREILSGFSYFLSTLFPDTAQINQIIEMIQIP